jgi:hypothetical protein
MASEIDHQKTDYTEIEHQKTDFTEIEDKFQSERCDGHQKIITNVVSILFVIAFLLVSHCQQMHL